MTVEHDLLQSMREEVEAATGYRQRATFARLQKGDEVTAKLWEHIAEEEDGHYNEFKDRLEAVEQRETEREELSTSIFPSEHARRIVEAGPEVWEKALTSQFGESHRPFPQTYTDWENLGYDIEAKLPDIGTPRYSVRDAVAIATGKREGDMDEAKRWLMQKAGELGVD